MKLNTKEKEILGAVTAVVLLVAVVWFFSAQTSTTVLENENDTQTTETGNQVIEFDPEEVMREFPEDFPFEEGAQSDSAYKYVPADSGNQQATLDYISDLSFSANVEKFENYLAEAGFEIVNETREDSFVFFYAVRDGNDLSVSIEEIPTGSVAISVSYLQK